ncbi:MAG TPA: class I SAM-dependent methyltransferase [Actinomycetota bacterium]|nr:class I SAM-dependent methyltransferase [Actinomycetota bacterium]
MSKLDNMRAFWDTKAQKNPLWYVTTILDYAKPDEEQFWQTGEDEVARVLADAKCDGGEAAAEIGCGVGRLTRPLAKRFCHVHAFDVSPEMVAHAKRNLMSYPGVAASATSGDGTLPLPDASIDFVLSMQVFHHIPDRTITLRYIREAGRVLRPGGAIGFQLRTCRLSAGPLARLERIARNTVEAARRRRRPPPADLDSAAWHGSRVLIGEIRRAARASGMQVESVRWLVKDGANIQVICRKRSA